jgi:hypothetical protein
VGVATAQLFPQLVLGGSAGLSSRNSGELFNGDSNYYVAGPAVNWTVFDGGLRKAGVKLSKARVEAAKAVYQDTVLRALREVESSLVAVDRAREQVNDLRRLSASARESATVARRDYERGILDQLTVLDAQRQSNRADMLLAHGEIQLVVNTVTSTRRWAAAGKLPSPRPPHNPLSRGITSKEACHEFIQSQTASRSFAARTSRDDVLPHRVADRERPRPAATRNRRRSRRSRLW